jgi:glycosyltransferase involved in cell wall biosynthesis
LVSVVIPTHDRAAFVGRAVTSALSQTVRDIEVLVVDDASTDGTEAVVRTFGDRRVRWTPRADRGGPAAARNTGLTFARGRHIAFLDSDDEWLERKLELQLRALRGGTSAGVVTNTIRRRGMPRVGAPAHRRLIELRSGPLTASVLLVPRAVIDAGVRFDERFDVLEDLDFAVQVAERFAVRDVRRVLVRKFRDHRREHAYTPAADHVARQRFVEKYRAQLARRPSALAHHHRRIALGCWEQGDVDQVRHHLRLAAGLSPRWWGGPVLVAAERLGPRQYRTALWAALTLERLPPAAAVRRPVEWALDHARSAVRRRR